MSCAKNSGYGMAGEVNTVVTLFGRAESHLKALTSPSLPVLGAPAHPSPSAPGPVCVSLP